MTELKPGTVVESPRPGILEGMEMASAVLQASYGPQEGLVILAGGEERVIFDDGLRAVSQITHSDPIIREGMYLIREACRIQHVKYGDGTSTCGLLAYTFCDFLSDYGNDINQLRLAVRHVIGGVNDAAIPPSYKHIIAVATTASHGMPIAKQIADAVYDGGKNVVITAKTGSVEKPTAIKTKGIVVPSGVIDRSMMKAGPISWPDAKILIVNENLSNIEARQWQSVFASIGNNRLVLVCRGADGSVGATFSANSGRMTIIKAPLDWGYEHFHALSIVTGAKVFDEQRGVFFSQFNPNDFGSVTDIKATLSSFSFSNSPHEALAYVEKMGDNIDKDVKESILSAMSGVSLEIVLPVMSELDMSHMSEVLEDVTRATRHAVDGVVPGGRLLTLCAVGTILAPYIEDMQEKIPYAPTDDSIYDPKNVVIGAIENALSIAEKFANIKLAIVSI